MRCVLLTLVCLTGVMLSTGQSRADDVDVTYEVRVYDSGIYAPIQGALVKLQFSPTNFGTELTDANGVAGFSNTTWTVPANSTLTVYIDGVQVDQFVVTQSTGRVVYLDYFIP